MDGLKKTKPVIKKIGFNQKGKMNLTLADGREIVVPLQYFPSIKRLSQQQREKWYVLDGELFSFEDCNEVFHIEQVLGKENYYKYTFSKHRVSV